MIAKKNIKRENVFSLFLLPIILTIICLFFIFEASSISAFRNYNDSFYYLKLQGLWFIIGLAVMFFFSFFDYHQLYYLSFPALLTSIVLLILVLIPGIGHSVAGARRLIDLGIINFQPTELAKFSVKVFFLCFAFVVSCFSNYASTQYGDGDNRFCPVCNCVFYGRL